MLDPCALAAELLHTPALAVWLRPPHDTYQIKGSSVPYISTTSLAYQPRFLQSAYVPYRRHSSNAQLSRKALQVSAPLGSKMRPDRSCIAINCSANPEHLSSHDGDTSFDLLGSGANSHPGRTIDSEFGVEASRESFQQESVETLVAEAFSAAALRPKSK